MVGMCSHLHQKWTRLEVVDHHVSVVDIILSVVDRYVEVDDRREAVADRRKAVDDRLVGNEGHAVVSDRQKVRQAQHGGH